MFTWILNGTGITSQGRVHKERHISLLDVAHYIPVDFVNNVTTDSRTLWRFYLILWILAVLSKLRECITWSESNTDIRYVQIFPLKSRDFNALLRTGFRCSVLSDHLSCFGCVFGRGRDTCVKLHTCSFSSCAKQLQKQRRWLMKSMEKIVLHIGLWLAG